MSIESSSGKEGKECSPSRLRSHTFGGKSKVASLVWERLGDVDNFVEPFMGSAAVLLNRPTPPKIETGNDVNCYVANFWRGTSVDPKGVAEHADSPVNEADLHARHKWLVLSEESAEFRSKMRTDPTYYDPRIAGWWCWGACCWIGSGWCETTKSAEWNQIPYMSNDGNGVHPKLPPVAGSRPQLADAFSRGRGVHGNDQAETCADRQAWLVGWFSQLRDRLRVVRVCCGDWRRVCDSHSTTTRLGVTGVFLDPPYPTHESDGSQSRTDSLYASDGDRSELDTLRDDVLSWCKDRGPDPLMRIAVCGYDTDGYATLETLGWTCEAWKASGGYGNRSINGNPNAARERIWFSPACLKAVRDRMPLFDSLLETSIP